jgi:L-arabinose isomerase
MANISSAIQAHHCCVSASRSSTEGGLNVLTKLLDAVFATIDRNTNVPAMSDYSYDIIR